MRSRARQQALLAGLWGLSAVAGGCRGCAPAHQAPPAAQVADAVAPPGASEELPPIDETNAARLTRLHGLYETVEDVSWGVGGVQITTPGAVLDVDARGTTQTVSADGGAPSARVADDAGAADAGDAGAEPCAVPGDHAPLVVRDEGGLKEVCASYGEVHIGKVRVTYPPLDVEGDGKLSASATLSPDGAGIVVSDDTDQVAWIDVAKRKVVKTWPRARLARVAPLDGPWLGERLALFHQGALVLVDARDITKAERAVVPSCAPRDGAACAHRFDWRVFPAPLTVVGVSAEHQSVAVWAPGRPLRAVALPVDVERVDVSPRGGQLLVTYFADSGSVARYGRGPEVWSIPRAGADGWRKVPLPATLLGVRFSPDGARLAAWGRTAWTVADVDATEVQMHELDPTPAAEASIVGALPADARARFDTMYAALRADDGDRGTDVVAGGARALRVTTAVESDLRVATGATLFGGASPSFAFRGRVESPAFSPSGQTFAFATCDGGRPRCDVATEVQARDAARGDLRYSFVHPRPGVLAWLDEDRLLVQEMGVGSFGAPALTVTAFERGKKAWAATCEGVRGSAALVSGGHVAVGGGAYCLLDVRDGKRIARVSVPDEPTFGVPVFAFDGVFADANELYAHAGGKTYRWSMRDGSALPPLAHAPPVGGSRDHRAPTVARSGAQIAVAHENVVVLHDATSGAVLRRFPFAAGGVRGVALSPKGLVAVAAGDAISIFGTRGAPIARVPCSGDPWFSRDGRVLSCERAHAPRSHATRPSVEGIWGVRAR